MTEPDYAAFESAFQRLSGVFQWRGKPSDFKAKLSEYFDALRPFPIDQVLFAGHVCRDTGKRFPTIADWRAALPTAPATKPADARWMRSAEADEFVRAERLRYSDEPCGCLDCQAAGVTDRPLRYVPDFTDDDREDRAWCPLQHKLVVAGHWAHGDELARWYAARDRFFTRAAPSRTWLTVALRLAGAREPGEEG